MGTPVLWVGFTLFVLALLAVDLLVFHRRAHEVRPKEALAWTIGWVALALLFNAAIYRFFGPVRGLEFFTGYLIELSLSVDNLFVFILIFSTFGVPPASQHKVLYWGILGAQIMRAVFILIGTALISAFHWVLYIFGAFLLFTGAKIVLGHGTEIHPEKNPVLKLFGKFIPTLREFHDGKLIVSIDGKRYATALLPVLVVIEASDLVFAVDSIPAIFGVTLDPFIVYTSNIFAILGLRALYFLLAHAVENFRYLKYGVGLVLFFIGGKLLSSGWYDVSIKVSLAVVVALLGVSVLASLLFPHREEGAIAGREARDGEDGDKMDPPRGN
ncbi:MAG: TerC family protein [Deltaproteobacteria bacterium]|nr:TerC family protein [Deltaproteobacteria bacterium]